MSPEAYDLKEFRLELNSTANVFSKDNDRELHYVIRLGKIVSRGDLPIAKNSLVKLKLLVQIPGWTYSGDPKDAYPCPSCKVNNR